MKNSTNILSFVCILFTCLHPLKTVAQTAKNGGRFFSITGLSQQQHGMIALEYVDGNEVRFDTVELQNGKFFLKGHLNDACRSVLSILDSSAIKKNKADNTIKKYYFILEPIQLTMKLDTSNVVPVIGGSPAQEDLYRLGVKSFEMTKESSLLYDQMMEMINRRKAGDTSDSLEMEISMKSAALAATQHRARNKILQLNIDFIDAHPDSDLSAFLIEEYRTFLSVDSVAWLYNKLNNEVRNSLMGRELQSRIKAARGSLVGKQAPQFISEDSNGKPVRLSDFSGYYVLLDFWASWCVPCRKMTPAIRELSQLFHPKLKVICISLDFHQNAWKKAIKEDSIGQWTNLWEGIGKHKETDLRFMYNVQPIPAFVLIDDKGKIIYRGQSTSAAADMKKILEKEL